jgi:hypothetical protein
MSFSRAILWPLAYLAGKHADSQVRRFLAAHQNTQQTQDRVLGELLAAHAGTAFARDHGLAAARTYEDFRRAVPVRAYEALRPYMDRVLAGETTALLPPGGKVLMFSRSSGSTGLPKHIPVTPRFLAEMRRGWNIFGVKALQDHPAAWLRAILAISSPMHEAVSPTGLPCGAISGLLAATQKHIVRRMYVAPGQVADCGDPHVKYYVLLRCGVGRDVSIITTANPSSTIKLIEAGQANVERLIRDVADGTCTPPGELPADLARRLRFRPDAALARRLAEGVARDGVLLPRHFWNVQFLCNWTGGTLGLYLRRLKELFGEVPIRDIGLLASEGRFSIPLADGTPAGVAEITANFLEFIPAGDYGRDDPPTLRAHELEVGQEYFLVLTNWAGLWRYSIDDRIRVIGHLGQSPVFEFLSRGLRTASITGEKITEHQVVEAMRCAAAGLNVDVARFTLQGRFAPTPYYELRLEPAVAGPAGEGGSPAALAEALDRALGELNIEYAGKRTTHRLGPIRTAAVPAGTFDRQEEQDIRLRHGRGEQYKHQYLLTQVLEE